MGREFVRSLLAESVINSRQMLAVKRIEFSIVCRSVLGAVPPIPIAAFGDQQFFVGDLPRSFRNVVRPVIRPARGQQKLPRQVVFRMSDPDSEVRIDP